MKKKFTLLFAVLLSLVGVTQVMAQKTLPYSYDFSKALDTEGWTMNSCHSSTGINSGAFRFYYNTNPPQYLISPELEAISSTVDVTFQYKVQKSTYIESFQVGYSTTNNSTASFTWDIQVDPTNTTYQEYKTTFPAGVKYVAIRYNANDQYYLFIDDFKVCKTPTCFTPTGLTTTDITSNSVTLSWTSDADTWNVQYKKATDVDWTDVSGNITSNPYTISGLQPATAYQARVRTYCDAADQSDWTDAVSFTTDCAEITSFPFNESFDGITSGIPACWNNGDGTTTNDSYKWSYHATGHDGSCVRFNSYNNYNNNTNFLKTPVLNLPVGKSMQIKFWYKNPTGGDFSVYISNDGENTYATELATGLTGVTAWTEYESVIPSSFTDNVVIVFKGTSNYGSGDAYIYLDDVEVSEAPACPKPTALTASDLTYQGATLSWTAGSDETEWKVIYGATGFDPATEGTTIDITTNPYTLTGLTPETAYDVYVKAVKGSDVSPVSNKANFTTTERYPAPTGLAASNITPTSATLTWTASFATSWEVAINTTGENPTEAGTVVNAATFDFTELTAETTYYAFVRTKDGDNYSDWSAACEFTPSAYNYLTVNDGTAINAYVPIYANGIWGSTKVASQFLILSSALTEMVNCELKKMTFYSSSDANDFGNGQFEVYLAEVTNTTVSSNYSWDNMTKVYNEGTLSVVNGKMTITFDKAFEYKGGNLLVGIKQTVKDQNGTNLNWYGVSTSANMSRYITGTENKKFSPKTTIGYQAKAGSELKVYDGETELAESPASFDFGLAAAGDTHTFTLKNTAATPYVATISSDNLTVNPSEVTPTAEGVTFTVTMPANDITNEAVVITPAAASGLEAFTINISGTLRDTSKEYQSGFNTQPASWTVDGTWSYSGTNGATTNAWYINSGTLTRLKTPLLTIAEGEKFIVEAKGNSEGYQHVQLQYSTDGTTWENLGDELELTSSFKTFTEILPNAIEAGNYYIGLLASQASIRMYYGGELVTGANFAINVTEGAEQDFGDVEPNATAEKTFTITNNGNADLVVNIAAPEGFSAPANVTIPANNGSESFTVTMSTETVGDKSGNIELTFDALNKTSFTIPVKGYVIDHSKLYVTFNGSTEWPTEIMNHGDNWNIYNYSTTGYARQMSTSNASSLILKPLNVVESKPLKFKAAYQNYSGRELVVRYTTDGGVTWTDYNWGTESNPETDLRQSISSSFNEFTVENIPAGTVVFEFKGKSVQLDDIIADYAVTEAPLVEFNEVSNGISDANLNADGVATYTLTNRGNAPYVATVASTGVTVAAAGDGVTYEGTTLTVPAGKTATITATMVFTAPYGEKNGSLAITSDSWVGDINVNYTATLVDPTDFVEDFVGNTKPAGWYSESWTYANGYAYVYSGTNKPMITERVGAESGKNTLTFDAKVYYGDDEQTLSVYTSTDRKNWTEAKTVTLTSDVQKVTLDALADGDYYVKFEASNAVVDNIKGVKKLDAPEHDLYITASTLPTGEIFVDTEITATVTVTSLRADETDVYAKLFVDDAVVATADAANITANGTKTFSMSYTAPAEAGSYTAYIKVYYSNDDVAFTTISSEFQVVNYPTLTFDETSSEALNFADGTYDITLKRTFVAGWNTICLPFEVQVSDIHADAIAYSFGGHNSETGELSFNKVTNNTLSAGTPYIIYVPAAITDPFEFKKQTLDDWYKTAQSTYVNGGYALQGTYARMAEGTMTGYYGVANYEESGEKIARIAKAGTGASMKGFRAYIRQANNSEAKEDVGGFIKALVFMDGTTAIRTINVESREAQGIFDMMGRKLNQVRKGVNIVNGKKVLVK